MKDQAKQRPDWKNTNDYPPVRGTSLDRWAYEFLIRNPDFFREYSEAEKQQPDRENQRHPDGSLMGWSETPIGKVLVQYGVESPMLAEWMESKWDSPVKFENYPRSVDTVKVNNAGGVFSEIAVGKRFCITPFLQERLVLEFDLTAPINPQIKRAANILKGTQEARKRGRWIDASIMTQGKAITRLYPFYLRVLDAFDMQASPSEICSELSKSYKRGVGDDTLRNWKKEAERLRGGGYKDIVRKPAP
jgi:hypothetical protein